MNTRISRHGFCTACLKLRDLERHHVIPRREVKYSNGGVYEEHPKTPILHLCHDCHLSLHVDYIDPLGHTSHSKFIFVTRQFLLEKRNKE